MWDESYISDPIIYTGLWNMGNREGSHKWTAPLYEKEVHEINYKNNILDGLERKWDKNGQLRKQIEWKSGTIISWREWDMDGNLTYEGSERKLRERGKKIQKRR